jgi:hypothetical protein
VPNPTLTLQPIGVQPFLTNPVVIDTAEYITKLKAALDNYDRDVTFTKGQLVKWKSGLKNVLRPSYNEPAIVVEVLANPIYDEKQDFGTPYFRQRLDLVLGLLSPEQDFQFFYYDSRRFEPFVLTAL